MSLQDTELFSNESSEMKKKRSLLKIIAGVILSVIYITGSFVMFVRDSGNFHEITSGKAYRSAQLNKAQLEHFIKKYGIRSVINLRGGKKEARWYRDEITICEQYGIIHYDIPLSATREPKMEEVNQLIEIFRTAPQPVLIHCKDGADRSGLAAAIWKVVMDGEPEWEAKKQLSIFYGHMPIGKVTVLDQFFEKWIREMS